MQEKGDIMQGYDSNDINNSRCLIIRSTCNKSWSYSHNKLIEVQRGDTFSYYTLVKINGQNNNAFAGIDAFNENKEAIQWFYMKDKICEINKWIAIEKKFIVNDNIKYIWFRLSGNGIGEFRFDNVSLKKEENAKH